MFFLLVLAASLSMPRCLVEHVNDHSKVISLAEDVWVTPKERKVCSGRTAVPDDQEPSQVKGQTKDTCTASSVPGQVSMPILNLKKT